MPPKGPKRKRLTSAKPAQKTIKSVINQSIHASTNQSNSLFCQLTSAVFIIVCKFLDLDCKCHTLSVLCHDVRAMFEPETCCREVKVVMKAHIEKVWLKKNLNKHSTSKLVMDCNFQQCVGRSGYMKYATSIDALYEGIHLVNDADCAVLVDALLDGINSGNLESLKLREVIGNNTTASKVAGPALKALAGLTNEQTTKFHTLSVKVADKNGWHGQREPVDSSESSLMSNPDFLPHLKRFLDGQYFAEFATVMTATGRPRPIEYIVAPSRFDNATFSWCWNVRHLHVGVHSISGLDALNDFSALDDDILPSLRELTVKINVSLESWHPTLDISALMTFISKRPIERLSGKITDGASRLSSPDHLTASVMHDLSRLRTLRELTFEFEMSCSLFDQLSIVPAASWPQLETLYAGRLSPDNVTALLQAAPFLQRLSAGINLVSLPEVAHCCTDIRLLESNKVTVTEMQAAFEACGDHVFAKLTLLAFHEDRPTDDVMHYLITKLSTARQLITLTQTIDISCLQLHLYAKLCTAIGRPTLLCCSLPSDFPNDLRAGWPWYYDVTRVNQAYAFAASRLSEPEILVVQRWDSGDYSKPESESVPATTV